MLAVALGEGEPARVVWVGERDDREDDMDYINDIKALGACSDALDWLRAERHPTLADAWAACPRGDWMLWLAGQCAGPIGDPRRVPLALAAADCAELALVHVPMGEDRPRMAIESVRRWARGAATAEEVRAAVDAAASAAARASAGADWAVAETRRQAGAVWAAAEAAAEAAARAARATTGAGAIAGSAAARAAGAAGTARQATLARCADIVRRHYPVPPVLAGA